jgi:PleD family two-component response regulator
LSVGIGRFTPDHDNPQDILQAADQSLYASKQQASITPARR